MKPWINMRCRLQGALAQHLQELERKKQQKEQADRQRKAAKKAAEKADKARVARERAAALAEESAAKARERQALQEQQRQREYMIQQVLTPCKRIEVLGSRPRQDVSQQVTFCLAEAPRL